MIRETIVNEVKRILHGPIGGNGEELDKNPLDFYSAGVLFPQLKKSKELVDEVPENLSQSTNDVDYVPVETNTKAEPLPISKNRILQELEESEPFDELELTTKFRPSAVGVSVLIRKNDSLSVKIGFATYSKKRIDKLEANTQGTKTKQGIVHKHNHHEAEFNSIKGEFDFGSLKNDHDSNIINVELDKNAYLTITTRPYLNNKLEIKTFTLINKITATSFSNQRKVEDCIFQPIISIGLNDGFNPFEDQTDLASLSEEDLNLKLLYRNYQVYALGHGISVNWELTDGLVQKIFTQVLPEEKVNGVDLNPDIFKNKGVLFIKRLSGSVINRDYQWDIVEKELNEFINLYEDWINEQKMLLNDNSNIHNTLLINKAGKNLSLCEDLVARMQNGVRILAGNSDARKAFEDANRAMFMQRVMADFSKHRRAENRVQHDDAKYDDPLPDYKQISFDAPSGAIWKAGKLNPLIDSPDSVGSLAKWRPFQLAFILSQVDGIVNPDSADRDTVDLIWFPTGGGKTEAYLGLIAFTIFYRRLSAKRISGDPDTGAGVTVLMRYTLRLLNKQQFERASILICSCDLVRRSDPGSYGNTRISNGIWMGRSMTPNKIQEQIFDYQDYIHQINNKRQANTFKNSPPILSCPCCGNRLVREIKNNQVIGRWGYFRGKNSRNSENGRFLISCTNTKCDFYVISSTLSSNKENLLPIYEVDETIYDERPSLLFSTVDKFVQLAWKSDCFNLFNISFNNGQVTRLFPSPELIIQDELHLISSALGTIYGVYEIVIDKLCREAGGHISKIVGATATVRNAEEQCKRLYNRSHFMQFPPPATDADDSFYSRKIVGHDRKNRLYVGFMPSGVTTSTALIRLAAVLLERIPAFPMSNEEVDNYYTLVVYFNALKELGKFRTFLTDDIVAYRKLLANHFNTFVKPFNNNALCELSSVMTADDITTGLDRLEKTTLPRMGEINGNLLVKKLLESGIRTRSDLKTAKGSVWKNVFLNKEFFNQIGLHFSEDSALDYRTFINEVDKLIEEQPDPVHIAPATNMISVGVDIPRLNTMIVNGQPKTTAEYIQASSRIGREVQGVVFSFLAPTKNRDRSHYEHFKAFHQAYYYYVESNSVTPFSGPALEKVLPTVLISLTRSLYLKGNKGVFSAEDPSYFKFIDQITDEIKARGISIYGPGFKDEINSNVDLIKGDFFRRLSLLIGTRKLASYSDFMSWDPLSGRIATTINNPQAVYNAPSQFVENILTDHLATIQTLRNVESSSKVSIKSH